MAETKKTVVLDSTGEAESQIFTPKVGVTKPNPKTPNAKRRVWYSVNIQGAYGGVNMTQLRHIVDGLTDIPADSGLGQLVAAMNSAKREATDNREKLFAAAGCDADGLPAKKAKKSAASVALDDDDDDDDE